MSLRKVKRIYKRIEYYEKKLKIFQSYVIKIRGWKKTEIKLLNKELKKLSEKDFINFRQDTGYQ